MSKDQGVITMVCVSGIFIIGKLTGSRLNDPRIFTVIDNGTRVQIAPLPGTPASIVLTNRDGFNYEIPDNHNNKNILDLYYQVTHPEEQAILKPVEGPRIISGAN